MSYSLPADQVLISCVISFSFWGVLSIACNWLVAKTKGDEYASRIVSTIHAVLSTVLCFVGAIDEYSESHWGVFGLGATATQQIAMSVTAGYFACDLIGILIGSYFDWVFVGHHVVSTASLFYSAYFEVGGYEMCLATSLMELSNPFMHMRWIVVSDQHPTDSLAYKVLDEGFFLTFTLARMIVGPYLVSMVIFGASPLMFKLTALALLVFSVKFYLGLLERRKTGEKWK